MNHDRILAFAIDVGRQSTRYGNIYPSWAGGIRYLLQAHFKVLER